MSDLKAELCKTCIHTNVCMRDKNILGDNFVPGNPMFVDNKERFKKFEEWEADGFPCDEYLSSESGCDTCLRQACPHRDGTIRVNCPLWKRSAV